MQYISFFFFLFLSYNTYSIEEFKTKQSLSKIRYISKSGKITYYQKNSGELQMSTNYNFANLMKNEKNTQYLITASQAQKKVAIEVDTKYYSILSYKKNKQIYAADFGKKSKIEKIGNGVSPNLHLGDSWLSYFDQKTREIKFHNFNDNSKNRSINLSKLSNRYFIPKAVMITPNDVIYTDVNKSGYMALLSYSFLDKQFQTIYKTKLPGNTLNFCKLDEKVYIGEFPLTEIQSNSIIVSIKLFNNQDFKNIIPIYSSELGDIGNLKCTSNLLFFVKTMNINKALNSRITEVASINVTNNNLKVLSDLKYVKQIVKVGDIVLASNKGKYYIAHGVEKLISDEINPGENK